MNSEQTKRARLEAIKDEVGQMHSLLKVLLPKLLRVQEVEYTHGTHEMGADFVFSRTEELFGDLEYVGVIAKIGKIVQNYTDVERQVKECDIERFFNNGKKKIHLSEIWVVATGSISHGAQTKIFNEYRNRKIIFVDGDRLSKLIDLYIPNFWTDVDLEIGDYLHSIWQQNDSLDRALSLMPTQSDRFYIEQDICEVEEFDKRRTKKPKRVEIHEQIDRHGVLLIEGGMGAGKSKLLRSLVNHYTTPHKFLESNLIPFHLSFKDLDEKYNLNLQLAAETLVPEKVFRCKSKESKFIAFVDGADEKDYSGDDLAQAVVKASTSARESGIKLVITSRWSEGFERSSMIPKVGKRLELAPLSTNRLLEFIRKLCGNIDIKSRLIEDLKKSSIFKELPRSPIAAILLAQLLTENSRDLPSNLTELYSKYTELALGRWDIDKGLQTQKDFEALSTIVTQIAVHFLENEIDVLSIDEAQSFFDKYLSTRNLGVSSSQLFDRLIKRCELILIDKESNTFRFKHKTFKEFFYAKAHQKKPLKIDERVWKNYWSTSYYFYVGLQKDCPELLEEIANVKPANEASRWMRLINMPNYLLAGFASPYEVAERTMALSAEEAADLYQEISEEKINSPFSALPKMQLFWFMQIMIRRGYAFDYFLKGINGAALAISDRYTDRNKAAMATFFLSAIAREINDKDKESFDFLLETYGKNLPPEIELAIRHETNDDKTRSSLVKKMTQRLGRAIKGNEKLQQYIDVIYQIPIRQKAKSIKGSGYFKKK